MSWTTRCRLFPVFHSKIERQSNYVRYPQHRLRLVRLGPFIRRLIRWGLLLLAQAGALSSTFGDIVQCFVPLIANAGLLINAGTPHWRRNIFWMLLALSCTMWMMGQFEWTYYEIYLHREVPDPFAGDIIFFLRGIPIIAALALRPHLKRDELRMGLGYLDFALLLTWWTFVYAFFVLPWMYVSYSEAGYNYSYNVLNTLQQLVAIVRIRACLAANTKRVANRVRLPFWRVGDVYAQLAGQQRGDFTPRILHRKPVRPAAALLSFLFTAWPA